YRLIGSALARVNWELNITRSHERNPGFYVDQTLGLLFLSLLKPPPFDEARSRGILNALRSFPATVNEAKSNLSDPIRPFAVAALEKLSDVDARLKKVASELAPLLSGVSTAELQGVTSDAINALNSFRAWLESGLNGMSEDTAVGRDAYIY